MAWWVWVIIAFVLGTVEVFTLDLFFANLVIAVLAAAGVSALGGSFTAQALTAAGTATVMLLLVRPVLLRRLHLQGDAHPTGTAAHVGRTARALTRVDELGGRVKLAGEEWSARTDTAGEVLAEGAPVRVVTIDGATAVVTAAGDRPPTTTAPEGST